MGPFYHDDPDFPHLSAQHQELPRPLANSFRFHLPPLLGFLKPGHVHSILSLGLRDTARGSDSQQLLLLVCFLGGGLLSGTLPSHPKLQLCSLKLSALLLSAELFAVLTKESQWPWCPPQCATAPVGSLCPFAPWCWLLMLHISVSFYGCFQWVFYLRHKLFNTPKNRDLLVIVFSHVGL